MPGKITPKKNNIFNIPANYHFFDSLLFWIKENYPSNPENLKIFLPNRRACREFNQKILNSQNIGFLPQIKAISDLSFEDFFAFLPNQEAKEAIDEILNVKILDGFDYLFFLSKEIQKLAIFGHLNFEQAFKIAIRLKKFFDEVEQEEVNLDKLKEIDDSNLSEHRQVTLEFLQDFHIKIKNSLLKNNIIFAATFQNFIIDKFCSLLNKFDLQEPIIIAGSTGSTIFGRKLIKAISNSQNGAVILHSLNQNNFQEEYHPDFLLNQLTQFLDIGKETVSNIAQEQFKLSPDERKKFIYSSMLPQDQINKWQRSDLFDQTKVANDLQENFHLIESKNEIEEAKIVSEILYKNISENKNSALISNNQNLLNLTKLELKNKNLPFNDSRNLGIFDSKLINFLLLILDLNQTNFNSHNILALLKHPLTIDFDEKNLVIFEKEILRKARNEKSINGIKNALKNAKNPELSKIFEDFIKKIPKKASKSISNHILELIKVAEKLSGQTWQKLLENEAAQAEIFEFIESLKAQKDLVIKGDDIFNSFSLLFSQISYYESTNSSLPIQILSNIEARLLNFDCVIIASLNEGDFPEIEGQNWIGKKIKTDLGINKSLKIVGQNAYNFCNYLTNKSVYLSRSISKNNTPLLESSFLLKLKALMKKNDIAISHQETSLSSEDLSQINPSKNQEIANPKPPQNLRPKKFGVTEISKLIADPYSIYARKILRLKELKEIDYEPSFAEFGSFTHEALEHFIRDGKSANFDKKFEEYFPSPQAKLTWKPKFDAIFQRFLKDNEQFKERENFLEIESKLQIGNITINGKIDRITIAQTGETEIIDYKTGTISDKKSVKNGQDPQLTLAALSIINKAIEGNAKNINEDEISSLKYWKLSANKAGEIKEVAKKEEMQMLLAAAKIGLEKLFSHFKNENNGYLATNYNKYDEYWHLKRLKL